MAQLAFGVEHLAFSRWQTEENLYAVYRTVLAGSPTIRQANFDEFSSDDLLYIFKQYDALVFDRGLRNMFSHYNAKISFRVSKRMTRTGGTTTHRQWRLPTGTHSRLEIAIAADVLFQCFSGNHREVTANGLPCRDRLEALLRIFEHELVHVIEFLAYGDSNCSKAQFKSIASHLFGHTESTHDLITRPEAAKELHGIGAGSYVLFYYEGQFLHGIVNRVTKRATVLVESPKGRLYTDGKKYDKYYVPVEDLTLLD